MYKYLFGPVNSRRLGISLGVDLVPYKICNLNCVYCESGLTTKLTNDRKEYIPALKIIAELSELLKSKPKLDYITFSGAGEPLLNSGFISVLNAIKHSYPQYKTALITNGTLFNLPDVRREVKAIDLIMPSLDAVWQQSFTNVNRPHNDLNINSIIEGLIALRSEFSGQIWLEYFVVPGINDSMEELLFAKEVFNKIKPDKIQLNSLDRPGTEGWVVKADYEKLLEIQQIMLPLTTEIISRKPVRCQSINTSFNQYDSIFETIKRRPSTINDLLLTTSLNEEKLIQLVNTLLSEGKIVCTEINGSTFYSVN